jgi:hypothetical protein
MDWLAIQAMDIIREVAGRIRRYGDNIQIMTNNAEYTTGDTYPLGGGLVLNVEACLELVDCGVVCLTRLIELCLVADVECLERTVPHAADALHDLTGAALRKEEESARHAAGRGEDVLQAVRKRFLVDAERDGQVGPCILDA